MITVAGWLLAFTYFPDQRKKEKREKQEQRRKKEFNEERREHFAL